MSAPATSSSSQSISHGKSSQSPARKKASIKHNFLFLSKFLRHGVTIASVWPSSNTLCKATIKQVNWNTAKVIVELGAGTGPITDHIIRNLQPHTTLIAIERDKDFLKILHERFAGHSNVHIIEGDVRNLDGILKRMKITHVDAFISGLPTPTLPAPVQMRMLASVRRYLVAGGVFSNITEFPFYYWKYYKKYFKQVTFDMVFRNMPPGGVYHCRL